MAPELFQDSGVYSYYSDFWSLGCIMIEMATGKPPFYTNSLQELIQQIVVQEVPVVPKFSDEFNDIIKKMLQKDPVNRINWDEIKRHPWWTTPIKSNSTQPVSKVKSGAVPFFFEKGKEAKYQFTKRIY
jgi:serine/threonine protein kinase